MEESTDVKTVRCQLKYPFLCHNMRSKSMRIKTHVFFRKCGRLAFQSHVMTEKQIFQLATHCEAWRCCQRRGRGATRLNCGRTQTSNRIWWWLWTRRRRRSAMASSPLGERTRRSSPYDTPSISRHAQYYQEKLISALQWSFRKTGNMETLACQPLVSGSKHPRSFCGSPGKNLGLYTQNPEIYFILAGKWFAMPSIMRP